MNNKLSYKEQESAYIQYMLMNVELEDWHAVSDAANDLRVLEAEYKGANRWVPEHTGIKPIEIK
jgi:hypothetical protein